MRPWRDVISVSAWEQVVQKTDSTARIGALTSLSARFDSSVATPKRALEQIGRALRHYHSIEKDQLQTIGERVRALHEVSNAAAFYLTKFKVDLNRASQRAQMQPSAPGVKDNVLVQHPSVNRWDRSPETGQFMDGNPARESLDRNLLTLARRSLRKARYLKRLQRYYTEEVSSDPLELVRYLKNPKEDTSELVGLAPGVRMEALDPFHRPVELHVKNGQIQDSDDLDDSYGITAAFGEWLRGVGASAAPFFMWLENHPICLEDDKELISGTRSVSYINAQRGQAVSVGRVMLVKPGPICMAVELSDRGPAQVCSTASYISAERKGGLGAAAYVWTEARELFVGQHAEGTFHHSSFLSGRQVRCAGMIKIIDGFVTFISNNSGHYKPGKANLMAFGLWLRQKGAMQADAKVLCLGGKDFDGNFSGFCSSYASI